MKKALTIILVVVAVLLITAYLLPSKVKVERSTDINNDAAIVFNQVNNLPAWETWGPWFAIEPEMGSTYSDTVEGINARHCWDSENPEVGMRQLEHPLRPPLARSDIHSDRLS